MTEKFHFIDCHKGDKVVATERDGEWWLNGADVCRILNMGKEPLDNGFSVKRVIRINGDIAGFKMFKGPSSVNFRRARKCTWVNVNSVNRLEVYHLAWKGSRIDDWRSAYNDKILPYLESLKDKPVARASSSLLATSSAEGKLKGGLAVLKEALTEILEENRAFKGVVEENHALKERLKEKSVKIEEPLTVARWLAINDIDADWGLAQVIGIKASKLCRERDILITKLTKEILSRKKKSIERKVNAYPPDIIEEVAVEVLMEVA